MLKVFANWGAMFATEELTVQSIADGIARAFNQEGDEHLFAIADVRNERPSGGSPIGLYWNELDAY